MPTTPHLDTESMVGRNKIVFYCAMAALSVALIVLAGTFFEIASLKTVLPGFPEMKPNTAVGFAIVSVGLFALFRNDRTEKWRSAAVVCGVLVFLMGSLTLGQYFTASDIGIDTLLYTVSSIPDATAFPGRMSPHTAFNFTILGITLILLNGGRSLQKVSQFLAILLMVTTFAAILGHLYGAENFYGVSKYNSMALHTAGLFIVCSFALVMANRNSKMAKLLASKSLGGTSARKLLPAVILVPTSVGWLGVIGQERGLFDTGSGAVLIIFFCVVLTCWIILYFCSTVHKTDGRRRLIEQELEKKEQRFRELFDFSPGMICIHDLDGKILMANPATLRSLGYAEEEVVGVELVEFLPESQRAAFPAFLRQIEHEGLSNGLLPLVAKNGKEVVWRYHSILITEDGKEPYVIGHAQDVTELITAQKLLKNLSLTDEMTGLYNRRGFLTMAEQQIKLERHSNTARGLTLMFADMDGLKQINDVHGHEAGSDAIVQLSKILNSVLRNADLVARFGGDEFVMLTIGSHDGDAEMILDRITDRIAEYNEVSGKPYTVACSIGVVPLVLDTDKTFESMIAEADEAMYTEKRRRKAERKASIPPEAFPTKTGIPYSAAPPH